MNAAPQETYGYNASTGNLAYKGSPSLTLLYNDGDHPHAATAYNGWEYSYDDNGNTTTRHEPGQPVQTLVYDAENRLVLVHTGIPGQPIAEYTYDGDGNLVRAEEGGKVTVYLGPHFEACLSGCAPAGSTPTPTPTAAATATPTSTATATATATSTPTPTPTTTATPTPTATATATPTPTSTSTPAGPYTFTSQPDASGLDTYLSKSSPSSTHGALEYIAVGEEAGANDKVRRSLLTFDLSSLPANAVVQSATLSLWMYNEVSSKDRTLRVYRLLRTWDEASATWNQASSGVNWQTAGANGAADRESAAIGSRAFTANESTGEKQFSLDAAKVQEWISGGLENRGMIVIADTERDDQYYFRSSDYTTASQRPKLVIVYTLAQGRAAPMQSVRANVSYSGGFQSSGVSQGNGPGLNLATQVKSRPRQEKGLRMQLSLVREPGVVWRSYYFAGTARIALREDSDQGSQLIYLFSDHLGSTSVAYRPSDGWTTRQWYSPWGSVRQVVGQLPTDRTFQGQRDPGWGLAHFGARWLDSHLGRFTQADSIIPGARFSIAWDRYAGLFNNPLKFIDPSGHNPKCGPDGVFCDNDISDDLDYITDVTIDINISGFTAKEKATVWTAILTIASNLSKITGETPWDMINLVFGGIRIIAASNLGGWFGFHSNDSVKILSGKVTSQLVAHELGHVLEKRVYNALGKDVGKAPANMLASSVSIVDKKGNHVTGINSGNFERTMRGYGNCGHKCAYHPLTMMPDGDTAYEDFADMFMNWSFNSFDYTSGSYGAGSARYNWINSNMSTWISYLP